MIDAERLNRLATFSADERLATYGSLRPGGENHHMLADIPGLWVEGVVHGILHSAGWAAVQGYPGLELDEAAA